VDNQKNIDSRIRTSLEKAGLRGTKQREVVYEVLCEEQDHPSADVVYERARHKMPSISMATVYNCLESFVSAGLARQLNFQRQSSRYCPITDQNPHFAHFHCRKTGHIYDVELGRSVIEKIKAELPAGLHAQQVEISLSGETEEGLSFTPNSPIRNEKK